MKSLLTRGRMLAALLPLGVLASAAAQSLGTAQADPWIGRPLELTVPVRFATPDGGDECVQADVFYGDQRLPRDQVRASVAGPPEDRRVRVVADAPIDEPVVTVALRAGCRNSITRSYTLLPAMGSGPALAAAAARTAGAAGALGPISSPVRLAATTSPPVLRPAAASAQEVPRRQRAPRVERARDGGGTPRLRLDVWEPEPTTMLRVSAHLTEPSNDAARRATAALLWQALNADPYELMRTSMNLQQLETELAQLRTTANQTRAEMVALRQALEAPPEGVRIPTALAQVLMLLVLAGAAAAAFFWWRTARQQHVGSWHGQPLDSVLPPAQEAVRRVGPVVEAPAPGTATAQPLAVAVSGRPTAAPAAAEPAARQEPGVIDFDLDPPPAAPVLPATLLRVETLAATFQEVEFLTSLGLWGDASDVLKSYIEDSSGPAPIAYFELMRLYAHDDDTAGAAAVRRRYARVFGADAPPLEQINAPQGLQARAELAARITRSWGKPQALGMLEELLFAVPAPDKALSLEAGRDLLCLYQVALELEREDAAAAGEGGPEHGLAPWAQAEDAGRAVGQAADDYHSGFGLSLDLDLDAAAGPQPQGEELAAAQPLADLELSLDLPMEEFDQAVRGDTRRPAAAEPDSDPFSAAVANEGRRSLPR